VCFSYLAQAQILGVDQYPLVNHGAAIASTTLAVAGDGPLTATTAAALGLRVGLIANRVGTDQAGRWLLAHLAPTDITHDIPAVPQLGTPELIVVADDAGTRRLHEACADLREVDVRLLGSARLAYIDPATSSPTLTSTRPSSTPPATSAVATAACTPTVATDMREPGRWDARTPAPEPHSCWLGSPAPRSTASTCTR
jgi:sugar/nucleoside kinase (ribokinase family)